MQEQTDQALGDVQGQLGQSETELNKMIDHKRNIERQQMQLDNQVKELKQECNMLRSNLAQLDQEKDQLLVTIYVYFRCARDFAPMKIFDEFFCVMNYSLILMKKLSG